MGIDEWTEGVEEHRRGKQYVMRRVAKTKRCSLSAVCVSDLGKT